MKILNNKLVISEFKGNILAFRFDNNTVTDIYSCNDDSLIGNIYVGVVSDVVPNINVAFITFKNGCKGYYPLNDNTPIYLNKKNSDKICQGDRILVQVTSDKIKSKDYTISSNISFRGRYVVYTHNISGVNISKKITDSAKRAWLKSYLEQYENSDFGLILRTTCNEASIEDIISEIEYFINKYKSVYEMATHANVCNMIYGESIVIKRAKDACYKNIDEIITDDLDIYNTLMTDEELQQSGIVRFYEDSSYSLKKLYSLETILKESLMKRVWLKSGAYLIIEHTEALHVIDVNTGKISTKGNKENIFFKTNMEAAVKICNEIRKRNLSGIIIVDFINMKKKEHYAELTSKMQSLLNNDDVSSTVVGVTNLGLMEITRKRVNKPLYEVLN